MEDFLLNLLRHDHPDVKALALALKCYQDLKRGRARNLVEVAEDLQSQGLDLSKDALYRAIRDLERKVESFRDAFQKTSGRGVTRVADNSDRLFRAIEETLRSYDRFLHPGQTEPPRIRVGAALSLCTHLVPAVFRSFREGTPAPKVMIELSHAFPQQLRERGKAGELDLVLTTCPDDLDEMEADVVRDVRLQMYLICPSDHPLASVPSASVQEFPWGRLKGCTVVLLTENRSPMMRYPLDRLPDDVRIVRVESYPQVHNLVLGGGDIVGFSFPQLFSPEEKRLIDAVKIEGLESVRVSLIRPRRARDLRGREENALIGRLAQEFEEQLRRIKEEYGRDELRRASGPRTIYHVSRTGTGRYGWLRGRLHLRFTEDGFVKGEHQLGPPAIEGPRRTVYSLFGRVARSPSGVCHLVWRATRQDGGPPGEDSLVSFICDEANLARGPLVGVWVGRQTWAGNDFAFEPAAGYVVVVNDIGPKDMPPEQLNQCVRDYERKHGPLEWPSLDAIETPAR